MAAWQDLPWKHIPRHVFRLPKRLDRATPHGQVRIARKLRQLLVKSWYARLWAVRRLPQDSRGTHPAGIDGVQSLSPRPRGALATPLRLDGNAPPLRRTWIPKRGSPDTRPRGIPTQADRARQTLARQALEPAWEAQRAPPTYGFRPGRSGGEAIEAICQRIGLRPPDALQVERAKGCDRIWHPALWAKPQASPGIRRHLQAWLKAGIMEAGHLLPRTAGTPPGGTRAPL